MLEGFNECMVGFEYDINWLQMYRCGYENSWIGTRFDITVAKVFWFDL